MLSWPKPCKPPIKGIIQVSQTWAHGVQLSAFNKATQIPRWHAACIKVTTIKDTKIESKTNHLSRKHWHFCRYLACEASHIASYLAAANYECSKTLLKVWCEAREESNENLNCEVHSEESLCDNKVYLSHQEWKLSEILRFLIGKAWKSCKKKKCPRSIQEFSDSDRTFIQVRRRLESVRSVHFDALNSTHKAVQESFPQNEPGRIVSIHTDGQGVENYYTSGDWILVKLCWTLAWVLSKYSIYMYILY